jgi:hypothetical protein
MTNKKINRNDLYLGQLVVCSDHPTAQVRTVSHVFSNSTVVELQWYEGSNQCSQEVDCQLFTPTLKQIEYSIDLNGKLVAFHDLLQIA